LFHLCKYQITTGLGQLFGDDSGVFAKFNEGTRFHSDVLKDHFVALSKRTKSFIDELQSRGGWVVVNGEGGHGFARKSRPAGFT
jgi:hypothetical protein